MTNNIFQDALKRENQGRPPVWLMRQAGRYHSHYQAIRKRHEFIEMCKDPELACQITQGPMQDFGFDAAILFSDLLFPLEAMGMGLRYEPGPKLDWHLRTVEDLSRLKGGVECAQDLQFQAEALRRIRSALKPESGLLGFVGGPFTLYCYAVEGSHQGQLESARAGLRDGRWDGFASQIIPLLVENMVLQAEAGPDTVAVLDTCAGELDPVDYRERVVPVLRRVLTEYAARCPGVPAFYYSKGTGPDHWDGLLDLPIAGIGVDWNHDLPEVLRRYGERWAIQGNVDPSWMLLPTEELRERLTEVWSRVAQVPKRYRQGWICGLGHGVLQGTPEDNVRMFVKTAREVFGREE